MWAIIPPIHLSTTFQQSGPAEPRVRIPKYFQPVIFHLEIAINKTEFFIRSITNTVEAEIRVEIF